MPKAKRTRQQSGRLAQRKGKAFNKEIAAYLAERLKVPEEEMYASMAGLTGGDVCLSRFARSRFPFSVECKNCKQVNLASWLSQAEADADGKDLPFLLVFKLHNRRRRYVCLDLEEFMRWIC